MKRRRRLTKVTREFADTKDIQLAWAIERCGFDTCAMPWEKSLHDQYLFVPVFMSMVYYIPRHSFWYPWQRESYCGVTSDYAVSTCSIIVTFSRVVRSWKWSEAVSIPFVSCDPLPRAWCVYLLLVNISYIFYIVFQLFKYSRGTDVSISNPSIHILASQPACSIHF